MADAGSSTPAKSQLQQGVRPQCFWKGVRDCPRTSDTSYSWDSLKSYESSATILIMYMLRIYARETPWDSLKVSLEIFFLRILHLFTSGPRPYHISYGHKIACIGFYGCSTTILIRHVLRIYVRGAPWDSLKVSLEIFFLRILHLFTSGRRPYHIAYGHQIACIGFYGCSTTILVRHVLRIYVRGAPCDSLKVSLEIFFLRILHLFTSGRRPYHIAYGHQIACIGFYGCSTTILVRHVLRIYVRGAPWDSLKVSLEIIFLRILHLFTSGRRLSLSSTAVDRGTLRVKNRSYYV